MDAFNGLTLCRREESNSAKAAILVNLNLVISLEELIHRDWIELVSGLSSIL